MADLLERAGDMGWLIPHAAMLLACWGITATAMYRINAMDGTQKRTVAASAAVLAVAAFLAGLASLQHQNVGRWPLALALAVLANQLATRKVWEYGVPRGLRRGE